MDLRANVRTTSSPQLAWAALAAGAFAVVGCTVVVPPPSPPHPPQEPAVEVAKGLVNGVPPRGPRPSQGLGIWIWRSAAGRWNVRSATEGGTHKFRGYVEGVNSPVRWFDSNIMELGDSMGASGRGMAFFFQTAGHIDGFQFAPEDGGCMRFHVTVDEQPQPSLIHLGSSRAHPSSAHFVACP